MRTGLRRNPLVGPVSTGKGVPGDGDALLIIQPKPIHDNHLRIVMDGPEVPTSDAVQRPKREGARCQPGRIAPGLTRLPPLRVAFAYFVIVPQAIRSPAAPAGSVFISSAFACTTNAVPPLLNTE